MKIKKPIMYMIAIAIVGLLITSASSLPIKQTSNEDEIGVEYLVMESQPLSKIKYADNSVRPLFYSVPITGGDYDEFHPSVAGSPAGGFYALAEETTDGYVWEPNLYGSADGVVWNPILTAQYANAEYTDMDQNVYATYGTFGASPDNSGQIIVLEAEIEDGSVWDFASSNINQLTNNHIACYTYEGPEGDPGTWNWGGLALSGYNGFGTNDFHGCPYIFYPNDASGGIIGWLTGASVVGCEHAANDIDLETNIM